MDFNGRVAFITGGGSGLGKAAALELARGGCRVAVLSRTAEEVEETARAIDAAGGEGLAITGDIAEPEDMQRAVGQILQRWGRLDIVFANAGINGVWAPLEELTVEEWDKTIKINLRGTFLTLKAAYPALKERGGSVIITSSVNGTRIFSNTGATAYSATKAAQVAMAKMLALEWAEQRIRVNVICPGAIESEIGDNTQARDLERVKEPVEFPEGRIPLTDGKPGKAEDVGKLVAFLASDASRHITGTEVWIDGAESLLQG